MKNELILKRCTKCGNIIEVLNNRCDAISCCGTPMVEVKPNTEECAIEKHIPTYEKVEDEILVKVNHVMEKEHYIEWICMVYENKKIMITLYPEQEAQARFPYIKGATLYAYCNKHGLWKTEVE